MSRIHAFIVDDRAQGLIEYALIIALISVASLAAFKLVGKKTNTTLVDAANAMTPVHAATAPGPIGHPVAP